MRSGYAGDEQRGSNINKLSSVTLPVADPIEDYLQKAGPTRGSVLSKMLEAAGTSPEAARKRLSRTRSPVMRFEVSLLPKNEGFYFLPDQRNTDIFWKNLRRDLRDTNSVFGMAIDGLAARGDLVLADQFAVISGAPIPLMSGQVNVDAVRERLKKADLLFEFYGPDDRVYLRHKPALVFADTRTTAEMVVLDAVREWARKLGFASYNSIAIRGEPALKPIGPFQFDLAGPSFLLPLQQGTNRQGFLVADVFVEGTLNEHHIKYFIRKVAMIHAMKNGPKLLPILVGERFTGQALTAGRAAGISLATPTTLFGPRVGAAIVSLVETLKNVAAYASSEYPDRIVRLVNDLSEIEGRSNNLRGILFEMVAAYLARRDAVSIDMGVTARDPASGNHVDIDVLKITAQRESVTCIECKGKEPGGIVTLEEVKDWLRKTATMRAYLANRTDLREATHRFELWTSGTFAPDALANLTNEKTKRVNAPIDWKDGSAILDFATSKKEKAIGDALRQHFLRHPLAEYVAQPSKLNGPVVPISIEEIISRPKPEGYDGFLPPLPNENSDD